MSLEHRVNKLEQQAGGPGLPWLCLKASMSEDDVWTGPNGETYRTDQLAELGTRHQLVLIEWADGDDWRSDHPGGDHIQIDWPE